MTDIYLNGKIIHPRDGDVIIMYYDGSEPEQVAFALEAALSGLGVSCSVFITDPTMTFPCWMKRLWQRQGGKENKITTETISVPKNGRKLTDSKWKEENNGNSTLGKNFKVFKAPDKDHDL